MPDPERLKFYRYLSAPEAEDYIQIMGRFTDALLAEWSAQDLMAQGIDLPAEVIAARCQYLADHGNLLLSPVRSGSPRSPSTRASQPATRSQRSALACTGRSKNSWRRREGRARCPASC